MNKLYFGDCLDILKKLYKDHPQGFIDLIYIDPPFNSKRNYNVLFEQADLKDTKAQKEAFADTWSNVSYKDTLEEIKDIDLDLFKFLNSIDEIRISKSAVSYITTMAIRIWFMHKILKNTGSFYLHCDPTMSHYLKIVCDLIFGQKHFQNEIIWKRMTSSGFKGKTSLGKGHDVILYYSKSDHFFYNPVFVPYSEQYLAERFNKTDEHNRRFKDEKIGTATSQATIDRLKSEGRIYETSKGKLRIKHYFDDIQGVPIDDVWSDIPPINSQADERLGYPTQKPEALLERIIEASSKKNSIVADLFCGCGTTIAVAEKLKRNWLGVDISHLAIGLIERRLIKSYGKGIKSKYEVDGMPKDVKSAERLAEDLKSGRFKFQDWVIEALLGGVHNPKKTADGGWDGHLTFNFLGKKEIALIEVKSGNITIGNIRSFIQVIEKQNAALGVFVCFNDKLTRGMKLEAKGQGYFMKEHLGTKYDKIQILTIEELLDGENIKIPEIEMTTFKNAPKDETPEHKQLKLL